MALARLSTPPFELHQVLSVDWGTNSACLALQQGNGFSWIPDGSTPCRDYRRIANAFFQTLAAVAVRGPPPKAPTRPSYTYPSAWMFARWMAGLQIRILHILIFGSYEGMFFCQKLVMCFLKFQSMSKLGIRHIDLLYFLIFSSTNFMKSLRISPNLLFQRMFEFIAVIKP